MSIAGDIREGARVVLVSALAIDEERVFKNRRIPAQGADPASFPFLAVYLPGDRNEEATGGAATVYQTTARLQVDVWATGEDADDAQDAADDIADVAFDALTTDVDWLAGFERVASVDRQRQSTEHKPAVAATSLVLELRFKTEPTPIEPVGDDFTGADIDVDIRDAGGPDGTPEITIIADPEVTP